jgi:YD repeat-containing protein
MDQVFNPTSFAQDKDGTYSSGDEGVFRISFGKSVSASEAAAIVSLVNQYLVASVGATTTGAWIDPPRGQNLLLPKRQDNFGNEPPFPAMPPVGKSQLYNQNPNQGAQGYCLVGTCPTRVIARNGTVDPAAMLFASGGQDPMTLQVAWTSGPYDFGSHMGNGMVNSLTPSLVQVNGTNTLAVLIGGTDALYFDWNGSAYVERFGGQDQLTYSSATGQYTLTDTMGDQFTFWDFGSGRLAQQQGSFQSMTDPFGNVSQVTSRTSSGAIAEVQRSTTVNGVTTTESFLYQYVSAGVNSGLVQSVTLRRSSDGGHTWSVVRQAVFAYYDGTQPYGNAGDLQTITVEDASGKVLDVHYYRYYTPADAGTVGYVNGLKYYFSPASYARLVAAVGNPSTATDAQVAPYADSYLQYNGQQQVTEEVAQGAGCSVCSAGLGTFTFSYATSNNPDGYNSWKVKTTETLPDGNQDIYYVNAYGQQMLHVHHDVTTGQNWEWFTAYDSQGHAILQANPSAVTGYDETKADLLNNQNGQYQFLSNSSGLITTTDYYATTMAGETTVGSAAGYMQDTKIQQGQLGTPILLESMQYFSHTAGSATVHPEASDTVYRNTDGTGAETTTFAYSWFTNTTQMQSMTTTRPVSPGIADQETSFFDTYGRPIWRQVDSPSATMTNQTITIDYAAYDAATGAVTKTITDVDTSRTSDFQNLPPGWATPPGGGLHLITTMKVDALGRVTRVTDPNGNVDYTIYDDPDHEVRTYAGWNSMTGTPTGPTQVWREDRPDSYTEMLTMSATPHLTNGVPDGTEPISNVQTLSRTYVSPGGQVTDERDYFNLSGVAYSTTPVLGAEEVNFYDTRYGYDDRGRLDRVQQPTGNIDRTVYDGLGRVVSTWVGTNDTPVSGEWAPDNNTGSSNMVQLTASVYDNGGVGDGNLTQVTQLPGGGIAPHVARYTYDFQDRMLAETHYAVDGVTLISSMGYTYDQTGNVVQTIDGDGHTVVSTYDGENRLQTETHYDSPALATVVRSMSYTYDHNNNLIRTVDGDGHIVVSTYDGDNRLLTEVHEDARGNVTSRMAYSYDQNGNVIKTVDGDGHVVLSTYDGDNRLLTEVHEDASGAVMSSTAYTYDARGDVSKTVDGDGHIVLSTYDNENRLLTEVHEDAPGTVTSSMAYTYDGDDNVLKTVDGDGHIVVGTYDDQDRLLTETHYDKDGLTVTSRMAYSYDLNGNVVKTVDGDGHVVLSTYDGDNRLLSETHTDARGTVTSRMAYSYDQNGNVVKTVDGDGLATSLTMFSSTGVSFLWALETVNPCGQ